MVVAAAASSPSATSTTTAWSAQTTTQAATRAGSAEATATKDLMDAAVTALELPSEVQEGDEQEA